MSNDEFISATLRRADADHIGAFPDELSTALGAVWDQALSALPTIELQESWAQLDLPPFTPPGSEPTKHESGWTRRQAEALAWLREGLRAGRLRAYGRRAQPDAPYEWIPRASWQAGTDDLAAPPWRRALTGGTAFKLDDGPAWCSVSVAVCEFADGAQNPALRPGSPQLGLGPVTYEYRHGSDPAGWVRRTALAAGKSTTALFNGEFGDGIESPAPSSTNPAKPETEGPDASISAVDPPESGDDITRVSNWLVSEFRHSGTIQTKKKWLAAARNGPFSNLGMRTLTPAFKIAAGKEPKIRLRGRPKKKS